MARHESRPTTLQLELEVALAPVEQPCFPVSAEHPGTELARLRDLERVALEFCARCERGEIRSVYSYQLFRAALAGRGGEVRQAPAGADVTCETRSATELVRQAKTLASRRPGYSS